MAKKSSIEKNAKRKRLAAVYADKRSEYKAIARDQERPIEERIAAQTKLSELPRNSAPTRYRNRCELTGRPRAFYRKLRMSRIALREYSSRGLVPGMVKSSW
jgi:small subunit ribosomal protein S14